MTCSSEPLEAFNNDSLPSGDVVDKDFENERRSLATALENRFRDVNAPASPVELMYESCSDEIADVWDCPVVAEFDELVIPQPVDAASRIRRLPGNDFDNAAQNVGIRGKPVFVFVDSRDPFPDFFCVVLFEFING